MYIYLHCVDPALPLLPAGYSSPFLFSTSPHFPPEYRIYMDRTGPLCANLNFGLTLLAREEKKKKKEREKKNVFR